MWHPVYVEATAADTEVRILKQLRNLVPQQDMVLPDVCAELRLSGASRHRKTLLVIDQFEQWLHANKDYANTQLVQAIRQCDGRHLQCVLMVRDDFWLAVSRFMSLVEIDLIPGQNIALVDLFDLDHAKNVLTKFGQAFGKLPEQTGDLSDQQQAFVSDVASGLAQDGSIVPVRLSLFSEMIKGKPCLPTTLADVGGTEGIGVNFPGGDI